MSWLWTGDTGTYFACMVDETDSTMFTWTDANFTIYDPINTITCDTTQPVIQLWDTDIKWFYRFQVSTATNVGCFILILVEVDLVSFR